MNKSMKGALLSALVFPGVGQISAGHKKRGWLMVIANSLFIFLIVIEIIRKAKIIINNLQQQGEILDVDKVSNMTSGLMGFSDNIYLNALLALFILGWFFSIIDAYNLNKR